MSFLKKYITSTIRVPIDIKVPVEFRVPLDIKSLDSKAPLELRAPVNYLENCYQSYEIKIIMVIAIILIVCLCFCCCFTGFCIYKFRHLWFPLRARGTTNRSWLSRISALNDLEANSSQQKTNSMHQKANRAQHQANRAHQLTNLGQPTTDDKSIFFVIKCKKDN